MKKNQFTSSLMRYPVALLCLGLIVMLALVVFLRGSAVDDLNAAEESNLERLAVVEYNAREAKGLEAQVEELEAQVKQVEERLLDPEARSENTNFFYSFEKEVDVVVKRVRQLTESPESMNKGGPSELKLHSALVYELVVEGKYAQILSFMEEVYRVDPIMRISDFRIVSTQQATQADGALTASMRVFVLASKG